MVCCRALNSFCVNQWSLTIRCERMETMTLGELKARLKKNENEERPTITTLRTSEDIRTLFVRE